MKRFALATVATLGGFGIAIACGDPYDGETPATVAPLRDSSVGDDETSAPLDDAGADVVVTKDAGPDVDPCDRDNDGYLAVACDGGDCDDDDDRVHPDASFVVGARDGGSGDFNCDNVVNRQYPVNVACGLLSDCSAFGFKADPPCGSPGEFVTCAGKAPSCSVGKTEQRVQACK